MTTATIQEQFELFHVTNPHIYELFIKYALIAAQVRDTFSARSIWERIRWDGMIQTKDGVGDFKLPDNLISRYARKFMQDYPSLKGFFRTKRIRELGELDDEE